MSFGVWQAAEDPEGQKGESPWICYKIERRILQKAPLGAACGGVRRDSKTLYAALWGHAW